MDLIFIASLTFSNPLCSKIAIINLFCFVNYGIIIKFYQFNLCWPFEQKCLSCKQISTQLL
ncbi:hypothetical protein BpHYR1_037673 [Brachionus plicatilis]|uniref:Uncharacterized protein n=1 Tax=Brachionus plicatilis TaxID=10195 RepID=A0A3M7P650_BRAPC|nr:hypothetical protein BpHYR1_037673 [Brachionus plicatilis]